jgi:hypothetical protein
MERRNITIEEMLESVNNARNQRGFLSVEDLIKLNEEGNIILDPFSTLVGNEVKIGTGNIFYPNTILEAANGGIIQVGNTNIFYPNTLLVADQGQIKIGNGNQFGDGGCSIKANRQGAEIIVEDNGRYIDGPTIVGKTILGSGTQIIGRITAQDCSLEGGKDFTSGEPDAQGAVLKGAGLARGIRLSRGDVLNGQGDFSKAEIERQSFYHPKS